jgi:death on curing protein
VTVYLSPEILLELLKATGCVPRDYGLLASCVERAATTLHGQDAYPTGEHKAAAILESLITNHPMIDGNRKSGWLSANMFLELNDVEVVCSLEDAVDFVLGSATGQKEFDDTVLWLNSRTRPLTNGE